ncbi:MAG: hypothetical protein KDA72_23375, partial [Planctomycetales bacterium]|nr:hypothetical protein [Planctomycetales bacterium]
MKLSSDGGASGHILNPPGDRVAQLYSRSLRYAYRAAEKLAYVRNDWLSKNTLRLLLAIFLVCLIAASGCHSLRARRQTRELS